MIARIIIPVILGLLLSDLYIDLHYLRHSARYRWWWRLAWWTPTAVLLVWTIALASIRNFVPNDLMWVNVYLLVMGLFVVPKVVFCGCDFLGWGHCRYHHTRTNWGTRVGIAFMPVCWYIMIYGCTVGVSHLHVKHVDLTFPNLPQAFDGYRIVQFSDAHVGSFTGHRKGLLAVDIDCINAQKPDLIAFTGDLQNIRAKEIEPWVATLSRLKAKDGVVAVQGNHDYSYYLHVSQKDSLMNIEENIALQKRCGWKLLQNTNITLFRGRDSLVIAGEENFKKPERANFQQTMRGVGQGAFTILLQHDPRAWDDHILPSHRVALTLSGHTHGGQVAILGLRPTIFSYAEDHGLYEKDGRYLYVSPGIGGLVPFRFGVPPTITVITLHK